jgi:hypothetical protein
LTDPSFCPHRFEDAHEGFLSNVFDGLGGLEACPQLDKQELTEVGDKVPFSGMIAVAEPLEVHVVKGE